ncbi:MAG: DUF1501 domain-containing protein [Armatimonadetes bacterium]|nr:DUF1501 domain-containing protein [Armatimonadota bacterium]
MNLKLTRRQVLTGAALAASGIGAGSRYSALANVTLGTKETAHNTKDALVILFLRGGADGLNMVAPYGDDNYYRLRPTLALARPNDKAASAASRALDLDGFFGLHPALAPLHSLYKEGKFTAVHGVGSDDRTRSHFEAMATMERGLGRQAGLASGWLARHLQLTAGAFELPLRAVAFADTLPDTMRGATTAVTLTSLTDYRLVAPTAVQGQPPLPDRAQALTDSLKRMYGEASTTKETSTLDPYQLPMPLEQVGRETLAAMTAIQRLDPAHYRPEHGAAYPATTLGSGFQQTACLLKGDVGMEVAFLEMRGSWDTHFAQGRETGLQARLLGDLAQSLAAFVKDLNTRMKHVTVLVMTEFGRRAYENYSLGTDHGRASCFLLLGEGVVGGKVHGDFPGLAQDKLEDGGDLRVTTDYRDILAEVLYKRMKNSRAGEVFPEYAPQFKGVVREI